MLKAPSTTVLRVAQAAGGDRLELGLGFSYIPEFSLYLDLNLPCGNRERWGVGSQWGGGEVISVEGPLYLPLSV